MLTVDGYGALSDWPDRLHSRWRHHHQSHKVFLANPRGRYLGRTCPWKTCGPGIRVRCDALHCGRRPYLHDDLDAVRLAHDLVREPPIQLWPTIVARVPAPEDLERELLGQLGLESGAQPEEGAGFFCASGDSSAEKSPPQNDS